MYVAIQSNDLKKFKEAVANGAVIENDFEPFHVKNKKKVKVIWLL